MRRILWVESVGIRGELPLYPVNSSDRLNNTDETNIFVDDVLDTKDAAIIGALRDDARISVQALADKLEMPRVTVHDRLKKLQERGIIKRFTVILDRREVGRPLHAFIQATYERQAWHRSQEDRRDVARKICELPFVVGCHIVTGDWDFLIEVAASGMDSLGDAILDSLSQLEGVGRTHTMVSFYDFEGVASALR